MAAEAATAAAVLSMQTHCVITIQTQSIAFSPALFAANAYACVYLCVLYSAYSCCMLVAAAAAAVIAVRTPVFP